MSINLLFAQNFSIGLRDGINWSTINGRYDFKNFENTQIKKVVGQNFGLIINYQFNNYFSLQTEFDFEKKGFEFESDVWLCGVGYSGNYKIKYISIPLLLNFEFGNNIKYFGYTGVYYTFLIKVDNHTTLSSTSSPELIKYDYSYDPTNEFNKDELGAIVGLGIKIPLCDKVKFLIDTRFNFGLTKSAKNTEYVYDANYWTLETPNNFQNVYNRSFTISLGILYKLNKKEYKENMAY